MPNRLSLDICRRFQHCIEDGLSGREAARRLLISAATASRLGRKIAQGGSLEPARCGPKPGKGKLAPHHGLLVELIEQDPDITLCELRDALAAAHGLCVQLILDAISKAPPQLRACTEGEESLRHKSVISVY